ncbi:mitochondrial 37S ribosomal protein yms-t [Gigaspora margarita]|uniref:Mitochondrial 37S ribosomal protein yms-t n=1 Tax=Gigaspora margarita TaxID=4874 RepID=A0A8H4A923_GIGMA|nr:mitochondrial 37S ribosomal protein yms-t [Gigaspora margarita]
MKIKKLKVRPRRVEQIGPCIAEMAAVLTCWSNSSVDSPACKKSVEALTECMRNSPKKSNQSSTINYHLARLGKYL